MLEALRDALFGEANTAIESALNALFSLPTPTTLEGWFQSIYADVWGVVLILSLFTAAYGGFRVAFSRRRPLGDALQYVVFFLRLYLQAILAPILIGLLLIGGSELAQAMQGVFDTDMTTVFEQNTGGLGIIVEIIMTAVLWLLGWALAIMALLVTWGVLPLLVLSLLLSTLDPLVEKKYAFTREAYTWLFVAALTKTALAPLLLIGGAIVLGIRENVAVPGLDLLLYFSLNVILLLMALLTPFWLRNRIKDSEVLVAVMPAKLEFAARGDFVAGVQRGWQTTSEMTRAARQTSRQTAGEPGRWRQTTAAAAKVAATKSPDPRLSGALVATGVFLEKSAERSKAKSLEGGNDELEA